MLTFPSESQGIEIIVAEIPAECTTRPSCGASKMLDKLFDYSNELVELVLEEPTFPTS